jgi:hypothetical protein
MTSEMTWIRPPTPGLLVILDDGVPREQQPWLASVWCRRVVSCPEPGTAARVAGTAQHEPGGVLFSSNPRGRNEEGWNSGRYGVYHDLESWSGYMSAAGLQNASKPTAT